MRPLALALLGLLTALGCGDDAASAGAGGGAGGEGQLEPGDVVQIAARGPHSCALRHPGEVLCWGRGFGLSPRSVAFGPDPIAEIAVGEGLICARHTDGTVSCLSFDGEEPAWSDARKVEGVAGAVGVSAGAGYACALRAEGTIACWGDNGYGRLGAGTLDDVEGPLEVVGIDDAIEVAAGDFSACALHAGRTVSCWGWGTLGQLGRDEGELSTCGDSVCSATPVAIPDLRDVVMLSSGLNGSAAVTSDGTIRTWGWGMFGEIGDGTLEDRSSPVSVVDVPPAASVHAGYTRKCAIDRDEALWCWGIPPVVGADPQPRPAAVAEAVRTATGGWFHVCALGVDRVARCWGANQEGALGDGTEVDRATPTEVAFP